MRRLLKHLNPYRLRTLWDQWMATRADAGPYRFLVRNWANCQDIDLLSRVLCLETFRDELQPVQLPLSRFQRYLVLAPHHDDESIGAGGTLLLAAAQGAKVHVVFVTDSSHVGWDDYTPIAERESAQACAYLQATTTSLGIPNVHFAPERKHVETLSHVIEEFKPEVILAPWLLDYAPKHRISNHLLLLANEIRPLSPCEVWGYQTHNAVFGNGVVDITAVADTKREMIRCYQTQLKNIQPWDHFAMASAAWNSRYLPTSEPEKLRYAELFFTLPVKEFLTLVRTHYLADIAATYRRKPTVSQPMAALHKEITGRRVS